MSMFSRDRAQVPTTVSPEERRARADALHRRVTATLHVRPPADGDVTSGCGLCGVGAVRVPGDRTFVRSTVRTRAVCASCRGSGKLPRLIDHPGPAARCDTCAGGTRQPRLLTDEVDELNLPPVQARDLDRDALARKTWRRVFVNRRAVGATGGGSVTLWLCPPCAARHDDLASWGFGVTLVEHLLKDAGFRFHPGLEELTTLWGVTHASRCLNARAAGRPEPAPNAVGWEHVAGIRRPASDFPDVKYV